MAQDQSGKRATGKIVVADDMAPLLETLSETLRTDGYEVFPAADGEEAMALVRSESPDLVLTDINMPSLNGIELCRRLKDDPATRLIPVMLLTGLDGRADRLAGIDAGADDFLTKPVNTSELRARVRSLMRLKRFTDELDSAESIIISLAQTVEARDKYTGGHCERMAAYAATLGMHLGLSTDEVGALRRGGYLHDIGKVAIPDSLLQKTGPLTADEFEIVKQHTTIGDRLCGNLRLLRMVRPIVRCHHERADGSGYPDGLAGEEIPLLAQIMAVVDVYDALTTDRPYRPAMTAAHACAALEEEAGRGWRRADLVREFTTLCRSGVLQRPETLEAAAVHERFHVGVSGGGAGGVGSVTADVHRGNELFRCTVLLGHRCLKGVGEVACAEDLGVAGAAVESFAFLAITFKGAAVGLQHRDFAVAGAVRDADLRFAGEGLHLAACEELAGGRVSGVDDAHHDALARTVLAAELGVPRAVGPAELQEIGGGVVRCPLGVRRDCEDAGVLGEVHGLVRGQDCAKAVERRGVAVPDLHVFLFSHGSLLRLKVGLVPLHLGPVCVEFPARPRLGGLQSRRAAVVRGGGLFGQDHNVAARLIVVRIDGLLLGCRRRALDGGGGGRQGC